MRRAAFQARAPIKFLSGGISPIAIADRAAGSSEFSTPSPHRLWASRSRRRISWRRVEAYRGPLGRSPSWSRLRRLDCQRDGRGGRSAALSINENLDALWAVMDDKIETDENAG